MPNEITRFENASVRGFVHHPATQAGNGVVLTHGAGANCASALLIAIANGFCSAGFCVLRFDLPFRRRRPFGPPPPGTSAEDRAGIRAAIAVMHSLVRGPVFAGGHSYGGRQATLLAAENPAAENPQLCDGLLLLSYPLHPPNKPAQLRTDHFPSLDMPALFVQGAKDPFGSVEEMNAAVRLIPSRTQIVFIDRAGHDLNRGKFDVAGLLVEPFAQFANS